jgi:two-component sensor histidine kinase
MANGFFPPPLFTEEEIADELEEVIQRIEELAEIHEEKIKKAEKQLADEIVFQYFQEEKEMEAEPAKHE